MADEYNENPDSLNGELDGQAEPEIEGLDEVDDPDVLKEKLQKVQEQNKQLFERTKKAEGFVKGDDGKWVKKPVEPKSPEPKPKETPAASKEDIDKLLDEKLEKRELDSLDLSEKLKQEVGSYAKLKGVSVKQALNSEYIKFIKEQDEKDDRVTDASLGGGKRKGTARKDYSQMNPSSFDLRTEQGRKDKAEWDDYMRKTLG